MKAIVGRNRAWPKFPLGLCEASKKPFYFNPVRLGPVSSGIVRGLAMLYCALHCAIGADVRHVRQIIKIFIPFSIYPYLQ